MTDRALTREGVLAGLQDIRLPADAPGGWPAEVLAAVGLGLILAAAVALLLHAATVRVRASGPSRTPVPEGEAGQLALLRRLKAERPERFRALAADLYRPGGVPDAEILRRELGGA